jgi:hypothetical protein
MKNIIIMFPHRLHFSSAASLPSFFYSSYLHFLILLLSSRLQSAGMWQRAVWWKFTDVSEERTTSVFRVEEQERISRSLDYMASDTRNKRPALYCHRRGNIKSHILWSLLNFHFVSLFFSPSYAPFHASLFSFNWTSFLSRPLPISRPLQ